jgi:DNA-directed RNA polymerase specialized sigma subunit
MKIISKWFATMKPRKSEAQLRGEACREKIRTDIHNLPDREREAMELALEAERRRKAILDRQG